MDKSQDITYYRIGWMRIGFDGSISIPISIYGDAAISVGECTITADKDEYGFWRWLLQHPEFRRRKSVNHEEIAAAKLRFAFESRVSLPSGHENDADTTASETLAEPVAGDAPFPADLAVAWEQWSRSLPNVDERNRSLLRAAFAAGYEAANAKAR